MFKRQLTWAELILILCLIPASIVAADKSFEYLSDRIVIEVEIKK